jgi:hypothetical protein
VGAHPFDYCGPTYTCGPGGCSLCGPRAGSILSGPVVMTPSQTVIQPVGNIDFGQDILSASEGNLDGPSMNTPGASSGETVVEGPAIGEEGTVVQGPDIVAPPPATQPKAAESTGWTSVRHHDSTPPATSEQ